MYPVSVNHIGVSLLCSSYLKFSKFHENHDFHLAARQEIPDSRDPSSGSLYGVGKAVVIHNIASRARQLKMHLLAEPSGLERESGRPHFPGEFLSDPPSFIKEGIQQSQKLKDNYRILTLESRFLSVDIRDWRSRQRPGNLTCTELWFYNAANVQSV